LVILASVLDSRLLKHPLLSKYTALVNEDLTAPYSRDIQKWLLVAPIIGVLTVLITAGITILILQVIWAAILPYYLAHHWAIVVGLVAGFFVTGLERLVRNLRQIGHPKYSTESSRIRRRKSKIDKSRIEMNANHPPIRPQPAASSGVPS
jgi:CBS domain containing-hemolysin-like protein